MRNDAKETTRKRRRETDDASYPSRRSIRVVVFASLLTGCAMRSDISRIERQMIAQNEVNARADTQLVATVASLARLINAVGDSVRAQQAMLTQLRGDTRTELYNIEQQLVAIQELTGQSQQRLSELRAQIEARNTTAVQVPLNMVPAQAAPGAAPPPAAAPAPSSAPVNSGEPTPEQLLDLSVQQLRRGSPGTARSGFAEFLRRYPDHPRAVDALFFTGEAWSADQRADSAAVAYRAVVQRYPQSPRAATSLYKLGLQALAAGRTSEARDAFNRVIGTYPLSEEAPLARERLRTLPR